MKKTQRLAGKYYLFTFLTIGCLNLKAQNKTIILGRPTDNSVTISIAFDQNVEYLFEYGIQSGVYTNT